MSREELDRQMEGLREDIIILGKFSDELLDRVLSSLAGSDPYDALIAQKRDEEFERVAETIESKTLNVLTLQQPVLGKDLRVLIATMLVGQRLQRVGHGLFGTARLVIDLASEGGVTSPAPAALVDIGRSSRDILRSAVTIFVQQDAQAVNGLMQREDSIDQSYRSLREDFLKMLGVSRVSADPSEARKITYWLWIAHKFERVADHAAAITARVRNLE